MPLCVLLWIIVILSSLAIGWFLLAWMTKMDGELGASVLVILMIGLTLTVPNLLWYTSVREALMQPREVPASMPAATDVEAPAVFHPELMVQ